jgi:hypothetical protein
VRHPEGDQGSGHGVLATTTDEDIFKERLLVFLFLESERSDEDEDEDERARLHLSEGSARLVSTTRKESFGRFRSEARSVGFRSARDVDRSAP